MAKAKVKSEISQRVIGLATDSVSYSSKRSWSSSGGAGLWGETILDEHRLFAALREPVAYRLTYIIAADIFDNWFRVNDISTKGPDEELDNKIQMILRELNAKTILTDAVALERIYGLSLIAVKFAGTTQLARPVRPGSEVQQLEIYDKTSFRVIRSDDDPNSDRFGEPILYELNRGSSVKTNIHFSRTIEVATRLGKFSVLDPVWDDSTFLRNIRWGMGQFMYRYGSGFPVIGIKGATDEQLDAYAESPTLKNFMAKTQIVLNPDIITQFEFKGAQGAAINPSPYYNAIMENISAGSGIPTAILKGAQAGALTGSEVNEREYFKVISSLQSKVEPFVRAIIDLLIASGQVDFEGDYEIVWNPGFEPSELNRTQADFNKEQANRLKLDYMTVDEVRAGQGLAALPGGAGTVVPGLIKPQPFGGPALGGPAVQGANADTIFYFITKCRSPTCGFVFDSLRNPQEGNVVCPKCGGPCDLWQGDNPPTHLKEYDQPELHPAFARRAQEIVTEASEGKITREEAIARARLFIKEVGESSDRAALANLRMQMKKLDITLSPEVQSQLALWREQFTKSFMDALEDALKIGEASGAPASPH